MAGEGEGGGEGMEAIRGAVGSIDTKKENMRKAYEELQSYSSALSWFTLQWKDIEDHFDSIRKNIEGRIKDLEPREKQKQKQKQPTAPEQQHPEIKSLCLKMDGVGLRSYILHHRKDLASIREEVGLGLRSAPDPPKLVLDAMKDFYPPPAALDTTTKGDKNKDSELAALRRTCLLLLEQLPQPQITISPEIKESAKKIALDWKAKCGDGDNNPIEPLALLQLLATYGIVSSLPVDDVLNLAILIARRKQAVDLLRSLSIPHKIPGDSSEEDLRTSNVLPVDMTTYKESSMYNNLLTTLDSGNEAFADVHTRRQREEGRSDSEDEDSASEFRSVSKKEEDSGEGTDLEEPKQAHIIMPSDGAESENKNESSDSDHGESINGTGLTMVDSLKGTSSFNEHVGHILTQAEVDDLLKRKWKYKWEVPAVDFPMSKWIGTGQCFLKEINEGVDFGLKRKLYKHWLELYKSSGGDDFHSSRRRHFFSICNSYVDILHCNKRPFYLKGLEEDSSIMEAYTMHALNHVFKTRDLVMGNEAKFTKLRENNKEASHDGFLDHGYTRPKVLILLPLASVAFRVVKWLVQLTPVTHKVNVEYLERFADEFGSEDINSNDRKHELSNNVLNNGNSKPQKSSKPSDYQTLFGSNNNDHFMIGIKFTRKSIKLYSDFYSSDIIIASPLGLATKIGAAESDKDKDVDYLSSIEVLIIDHADIISMQNWSHVNSIVEHLNHIPSKQHGIDVMRIRQWYLNGQAQFYRQTILLSSYLNPDMNSLFNHQCLNYQGKVKLVTEHKGVLPKILLQVRQIYERFDMASITDADNARLGYFTQKVFPRIKDSIEGGTMIFISSYFEFVPLRNFLKSQNSSFCLLGDYTKQSDISRARVRFFDGRRKMMLYTERAHFYHRYKIRGIKKLIIYSLPERKEFYTEIVNMLEDSEDMSCTVLFSRFDKLRLERIVGTTHAKRLMSSDKGIFVFC